jgi:ABC-type phosphate/phosphonate transport system permease subunit
MPARTPEEIRASIEHNRHELGSALEKVRAEVVVLTDWRSQLRRNQEQLTRGAAVAGFVVGGGIAGLTGIVFGRGKRKQRRR